jgi:hypothetical protein
VAGEPNRQHDPQPQVMLKMTRMEASDAPTPQASGEYHAYALPGRTALPDGSVQRVPLLADADAVACVRRYETAPSMPGFHPPQPIVHVDFGPTGPQPVMAMLQFANRKDAGLGIPLPAGRVRVFERNEGGDAFLGEAMLGHTASGREVRLALGEAFDLSLERTRDAFALDPDRHGATEAVTLVLRNAKSSAATVRVLESLPRWSDWRIDESTVPAQKHDAQTAAFEVEVPAGGEATVRYRVRYRWPDTPTPP